MANSKDAEIERLTTEVMELRRAVVAMCDTYSANRSEKQKVKAYRYVAAKGEGPFSLAAVEEELAFIERRDLGEIERLREALTQIAERTSDPAAAELAHTVLRAPRPR